MENTYKYLSQQLHPIFAGYLHDGLINKRDVVATLFKLNYTNHINIIFKDGNVMNHILGIKFNIDSNLQNFEKFILNYLFNDSDELLIANLNKKLNNPQFYSNLTHSIESTSQFKLLISKLKFETQKKNIDIKMNININGNDIDTVEENIDAKPIIYFMCFLFTLIGVGLFLTGLTQKDQDSLTLLLIGSIFTFVGITIGLIYYLIDKKVDLKFEKDKPFVLNKYEELAKFIKDRPLDNQRRLDNEFIAFAIAFGINNAFNKDFLMDDVSEIVFNRD